MLLIPSIDLRGGRCVRLFKGDFAQETRYDRPVDDLMRHYHSLGARWLHLVDLDGARDGAQAGELPNRVVIRDLTAQKLLSLQVGGGVRDQAALDQLFALGAQRAVVGSAAVEKQAEVARWLRDYGPERICLAFDVQLDAQGVPRLKTRGWQQQTAVSLWEAMDRFVPEGLRHVLCTDIERDGALAGPNLSLYDECLRRYPTVQWQASGGISSQADLAALAAHRVPAAISGKALLEGRITPQEMKSFLPDA
ncbi:MAG TPA: 1-(5-phosphoribosyl)-5-[(5-phosphoribosylamino)methylideneamino] imidazole-4-carboxamide isomerase [Steroidobacteraceae bacterium]|jgi:phosphoribosylformimino-5-aminoimidazole carboxamide ribotide isomerase|nr:1-(5-phosphoribosyl)-5-[(5-phosphoribosylamino)methylideneamino] imidazole-4-carboxamide isomerase [Steroidobacteraceae bacterium]